MHNYRVRPRQRQACHQGPPCERASGENKIAMDNVGDVRSPAAKRLVSICEARALASDPVTVALLLQAEVPPEQMATVNAVRAQADAGCVVPLGI